MTIETYPEMNAKIVEILRTSESARIGSPRPSLLYAAQRIEELEQIAGIRGKCLEIAMETLEHYATSNINLFAQCTLVEIKQHLAELEPEESTQ